MGLRDLKNNLSHNPSIHPQTLTATLAGKGVDLQGAKSALVEFHIGAYGSGSWTPSVEESDDGDSVSPLTYTAVAAGDLEGALVAVTGSGQENAVQRVGYKGTKRYIRPVLTTASSPASLPVEAQVIVEPNAKPAA